MNLAGLPHPVCDTQPGPPPPVAPADVLPPPSATPFPVGPDGQSDYSTIFVDTLVRYCSQLAGFAPTGLFTPTAHLDRAYFQSAEVARAGRQAFSHCVGFLTGASHSYNGPMAAATLRQALLYVRRSAGVFFRSQSQILKQKYRELKNRTLPGGGTGRHCGRGGADPLYAAKYRHHLNTVRRCNEMAIKYRLSLLEQLIDHLVCAGHLLGMEELEAVANLLSYVTLVFNNVL